MHNAVPVFNASVSIAFIPGLLVPLPLRSKAAGQHIFPVRKAKRRQRKRQKCQNKCKKSLFHIVLRISFKQAYCSNIYI